MATLERCCGFECGRSTPGTNISGHWTLSGTASFDTATKRSGDRSLRTNPTAGVGEGLLAKPGSAVSISRSYVNIASAPIASGVVLGFAIAGSVMGGLAYKTTDGLWYAAFDDGITVTFGATGVSISTGTWVKIDIKADASANPWLVAVSVDGVALGQASLANVADTSSQMICGAGSIRAVNTFDIYHDDFIESNTAEDYPLAAGQIFHYVPTSDGTHNTGTAGTFIRGSAGANITDATTDSYLLIDEVPLDDTTPDTNDYINQAVAGSTNYVENKFGPAPGITTPGAPDIVEVIYGFHQEGTGLGGCSFRLNDNGTESVLNTLTNVAGVTTTRYDRNDYQLMVGGGAWTLARFENLRFRFGYSGDANPDQYLDCAMIEAHFPDAGNILAAIGFQIPVRTHPQPARMIGY